MKAKYVHRSVEELDFKSKDVSGMLNELYIDRSAVLVIVNDSPVIESYKFKKGDRVKILNISSGG